MGRLMNAATSGALLLGLVLAGCGGGSSSTSSTNAKTSSSQSTSAPQSGTSSGAGVQTAQGASPPTGTATSAQPTEHTPKSNIKLSSTAFAEGKPIPAHYTCDGADTSPPLKWRGVPAGTVELVMIISAFNRTGPGGGELISWAVAGLKPSQKGISAGKLPPGAIVGRNSFGKNGYTLCPKKGEGLVHYLWVVYGLKHPLSVQPGFDANTISKTASHIAEYSGLTGFSYTRK
jgi:phosphatidylethanolamine-binding protein (PEBP) family uncharacterized protein